VKKGFELSMQNGVLAGFQVESIKVRLIDGSTHPVDSDALAFEIASRLGFKEACKKAKLILLEPIMKVEVVTPEEYTGEVTGDLNKRRAELEGVNSNKIGIQLIDAKVPLSEMFGYITSLRSLTSGRATATLEFSHYAEAPQDIIDDIVYKVKGYLPVSNSNN
jgi:elongation factor G